MTDAPPRPTGPTLAALTEDFTAIDAYLQAVHEILQEGHMPDIADLDDRVSRLCAGIGAAAPDVQEACGRKLQDLLKKIEFCEEEMRAFHATQKKGAL